MDENNVSEVVEVAVEEAVKKIDGESFALGTIIGAALTGGVLLFVKKVAVPVGKKIKIRIEEKKASKTAEFEKDGFEEQE